MFWFPSPFFLPAVAEAWYGKEMARAVGLLGTSNPHPWGRKVSDAPHYWALKTYPQNMVCLTRIVSVMEDSDHLGPQLCAVKENHCIDLHLQGNAAKMWCRTLFLPDLYYSKVCFLMFIRETMMTSDFFYAEGIVIVKMISSEDKGRWRLNNSRYQRMDGSRAL